MSATLLVAAPFRARRLRQFPGGIFPVGRGAGASRRASGATWPFQQRRLSLRSAALDLPSGHITDHGAPMGPRAAVCFPAGFGHGAQNGKSNAHGASERGAALGESAPTFTRRHIPAETERGPKAANT